MARTKVTAKKKIASNHRRAKRRPRKPEHLDIGKIVHGGLRDLVSGITKIGGLAIAVFLTPEDDIKAAGGDLTEAMNGHKCGVDCWHAIGETQEERQSWWNQKMEAYERARMTREAWRKKPLWGVPQSPPAEPERST